MLLWIRTPCSRHHGCLGDRDERPRLQLQVDFLPTSALLAFDFLLPDWDKDGVLQIANPREP